MADAEEPQQAPLSFAQAGMKSLIISASGVRAMDWATAEGIKRNNVDFLRLFLAVMVIYSHSFLISRGPVAPDTFEILTHGQINGGYLAVNCFFAISGFLIARSWASTPRFWPYLRRRARRIIPGYLAAMLVCVILVGPLAVRPWQAAYSPRLLGHALTNSLLLKAYPGDSRFFSTNPSPAVVNGSMWTIEFEFGCYLLLGLAGVIGLLRSRRVCLVLFGAAMIWFALQQFGVYDAIHWGSANRAFDVCDRLFGGNSYQWPRLVANFWSGVCFYAWRTKIPRSKTLAIGSLIALLVGIWVKKEALFFPVACTYLLFFIAYSPALHLENFGRHGDYSYGTYLYAFPIQQLIILARPGLSPAAIFALSTPASIAAGALSWFGVEQHFGLRHRRLMREGLAEPARLPTAAGGASATSEPA